MTPFFQPAPTRVKICGVRSDEQAADIAVAGADAIGLNFWPKSKRYLAPEAADWAAAMQGRIFRVAVLVNAEDALIEQIVGLVDAIQLHGDESPARCQEVASLGLPVIKALQVKDTSTLDTIPSFQSVAAVLLDSYNPGQYGGEGRSFPWHLAQEARRRFPDLPLILAGGLTPQNVAEAVAGVQPAAVDVATGVESAPGVKDMDLVRAFIKQVRTAANAVS
jgi:phosphoribosylanthranilate isomerase